MNPTPEPPAISPDALAAALRRYYDVQPERSAVDLLIGHRHWLSAREFLQHVDVLDTDDDGTPRSAAVHWDAADRIYRDALAPATGSELAVLGVACSLAIGPLAAVALRCDTTNRAVVQAAVEAALGRG